MNYFFLSFRNPEINRNLGVSIVKAETLHEAICSSHEKKINPGGEVLGSKINQKTV